MSVSQSLVPSRSSARRRRAPSSVGTSQAFISGLKHGPSWTPSELLSSAKHGRDIRFAELLLRQEAIVRRHMPWSALEFAGKRVVEVGCGPLAGFGPGVFQFKFFAYQRPEEMTRISRTAPIEKRGPDNYGRGGGAHSEYLQALAELGWPGLAIWLLLAGGSAAAAAGRYRRTGSPEYLLLAMALLSFFLHGLVNNFLHDARIAALMWGGMACLARGPSDP